MGVLETQGSSNETQSIFLVKLCLLWHHDVPRMHCMHEQERKTSTALNGGSKPCQKWRHLEEETQVPTSYRQIIFVKERAMGPRHPKPHATHPHYFIWVHRYLPVFFFSRRYGGFAGPFLCFIYYQQCLISSSLPPALHLRAFKLQSALAFAAGTVR